MPPSSVTRGHGLLEWFLASRRAHMANRLIPDAYRSGRILDIGCGSYPFFLTRTVFADRIGVDRVVPAEGAVVTGESGGELKLISFDILAENTLPLRDQCVDVVTMLAVFEHIANDRLVPILNEIARVLKPGGMCIMTTPAGWTGPILTVLKWLRLVSAVEIDEHQDSYSIPMIRDILSRSNMEPWPMRFGYFELGMNIWVQITRPVDPPPAPARADHASAGEAMARP